MPEDNKADPKKVGKLIQEFETANSEAAKAANELGFPDIANSIVGESHEVHARIVSTIREMYRKVRDDASQFEVRQKQAMEIIEALEKSASEGFKRKLEEAKGHFKELEHAEHERKEGEAARTNEILEKLEEIFSRLIDELQESAKEAGAPDKHEEILETEHEPPRPAEARADEGTSSSTTGIEAVYTTPSEEQEEHPPEETAYTQHDAPATHEAEEEEASVEDKINNGIFIIMTTADGLEKAETEAELKKVRKTFRKSVETIKGAIQRLLARSRGPELNKIASQIKAMLDERGEEMLGKIKDIPDSEAVRRKILIEDKRPEGEQKRRIFRLVSLHLEFVGLSKFVDEESARLA